MNLLKHLRSHIQPAVQKPLLFVHTPKCCGKFVERAFGQQIKKSISLCHPDLRGHLFWSEYKRRLDQLNTPIEDFLTFAVVRNPFAWRVSFFTYIQQDTGGRKTNLAHLNALFNKMTFSNYVDWLCDPATPTTQDFRPHAQVSDWIVDQNGAVAVNYLLRQERLVDDLKEMSALTGVAIKIPSKKINVSNDRPWYSFYKDADVDKITALHTRDIALFGYAFADGSPVKQHCAAH
jgi:hypothetical protein